MGRGVDSRAGARLTARPVPAVEDLGVVTLAASLNRPCSPGDGFRRGGVDTGFIDRNLAALGAVPRERDKAAAALGVAHLLDAKGPVADPSHDDDTAFDSPWSAGDGFQLGGTRSLAVPIVIDGESANVTVVYDRVGVRVYVDGVAPSAVVRVF